MSGDTTHTTTVSMKSEPAPGKTGVDILDSRAPSSIFLMPGRGTHESWCKKELVRKAYLSYCKWDHLPLPGYTIGPPSAYPQRAV